MSMTIMSHERTTVWTAFQVFMDPGGPRFGGHICDIRATGEDQFDADAIAAPVLKKFHQFGAVAFFSVTSVGLFLQGRDRGRGVGPVVYVAGQRQSGLHWRMDEDEILRQRVLHEAVLEENERMFKEHERKQREWKVRQRDRKREERRSALSINAGHAAAAQKEVD